MLHKRSIKEKLLKGGAWAFAGKLGTVFAGLVVNALLARMLSPDDMGAYFLLFSVISILSTVSQFGMSAVALRTISSSLSADTPEQVWPTLRIMMLTILTLGSLMLFFLHTNLGEKLIADMFHSSAVNAGLSSAAVLILIMSLQSFFAEMFRGFHDIRLATVFGGLLTSVLILLMLTIIWVNYQILTISGAFNVTAFASGISLLAAILFFQGKVKLVGRAIGKVSYSAIMASSFPLLLFGLLYFSFSQAPVLVLGMLTSEDQVALFGAAMRLVMLITMPLIILNAVLPPIIAELWTGGKREGLERLVRNAATLAGIPAVLVLLVFALFSEPILEIVFGQFYGQGASILIVLCLGQMVNVWAGSCGLVLVHTGYEKSLPLITFVSALVTIILGVLLVRVWGAFGMAVAFSLGMALQNILMLYLVRKKLGIWSHMMVPRNVKSLLRFGDEK